MVQVGITIQEKPVHPEQLRVYDVDVQSKEKNAKANHRNRVILGAMLSLVMLASIVMLGFIIGYYVRVFSFIKSNTAHPSVTSESKQDPFTFDDIFDASLRPRSVAYSWYLDDSFTFRNSEGDIVKYDIASNMTEIILEGDIFDGLEVASYSLSPDGRYLLLPYDYITELQDTSFRARYKVYDLEEGEEVDFPNTDESSMKGAIFDYCGWRGEAGARLTFLWGNNLYYAENPDDEVEALTTNGQINNIKNGEKFWNERGAVANSPVHGLSPNGRFMAYGEFDATDMKKFQFPWYGAYSNSYGETYTQTYLKAGDPYTLAKSRLLVVDLQDDDRTTVHIPHPDDFDEMDVYFFRTLWRDNNHLAIGWINRAASYVAMEICNVQTLQCNRNYEQQVSGGWFDSYSFMRQFIDESGAYLSVLPNYEGDENGYFRQVAMTTADVGGVGFTTFLTSGPKEVTSILAYDNDLQVVYYSGVDDVSYGRQIFRVGTPAAEPEYQQAVCVSCSFDPSCGWASASFSSSAKYVLFTCNGPDIPHQRFIALDGSFDVMIENNAALRERLENKAMPTREMIELDVGGGYTAWAEMIKPPNFIDDGSKQYPVLMYPYAGPSSNQATLQFKIGSAYTNLETYMASSNDVIGLRIDGRGTAGRGDRYTMALHRNFGDVEIEDQIVGAHTFQIFNKIYHQMDYFMQDVCIPAISLKDEYRFVNQEQVAVWGGSYGGFVASSIIGNDSDVINCGVAIAPVTNWRYYYGGYTERYNGRDIPEDNELGYNRSDVIRKVENFRTKKFYMAHGTADDNVHFQHAAQLVKALTENEIEFKFMMYTDEAHSVRTTIRHMIYSIADFVMQDCWGVGPPAR